MAGGGVPTTSAYLTNARSRGLLKKWGAAAPTHASGAGAPVLR